MNFRIFDKRYFFILLLSLPISIIVIYLANFIEFDFMFFLIQLFTLIFIIGFISFLFRNNRDFLEIIYIFLLFYYLYFFVKPIQIIYGGDIHKLYGDISDNAKFNFTLVISLIFLISFCIGYRANNISYKFTTFFPKFGVLKRRYTCMLILFCMFASIISYVSFYHSRGLTLTDLVYYVLIDTDPAKRALLMFRGENESSYISQLINFGKSLVPFTLYLTYIYFYNKPTRISEAIILRIFFLIYLVVSLIVVALTGLRGSVILLLFGLLILVYFYGEKKFKTNKILIIFFVMLGIVDIMSFLRYRTYYTLEEKSFKHVFIESLLNRGDFESLWAVTSNIPNNIPYFKGQTYVDMFILRFIPRSIWSEKPMIYGADRISEALIRSVSYYNTHSCVPMPAEAYANFGLIGVIIIGFLWGILFKAIYIYFDINKNNPLYGIIYASFYCSIVALMDFSTTYLVNWAISMAFFYLLIQIISIKHGHLKVKYNFSLSEKTW